MSVKMTPEGMKQRTMAFALGVIRLVKSLPRGRETDLIGRQLLRAGTGAGANYRGSCRSRTDGDFLARMGLVEEEADESLFWMELLMQARLIPKARLEALMREADEIVRIVVASIRTVKERVGRPRGGQSEIRIPKSEM